jgi:O-antigen/teichoic acid export membrane protein
MFPMVAGRHKANQKHGKILFMTMGLITAVSGSIVIVYAIAPRTIIGLLFGAKYLPVAPYLAVFGIAMLLLALSTAMANYYLAINSTKCVSILVIAALAQAAALWFYHGSLTQIVTVMVVSMGALFAALAVYYLIFVRNITGPEPEEPITSSVAV